MEHRRLRILFAIISLFAFAIIVWYFLFSTPTPAPTLETTANPLSLRDLPARLGFIFSGNTASSTTETEVTYPGDEPFIQVWDKPSTGNTFTTKAILKEEIATSTKGTTTETFSKTVRATSTILMFVDRVTGYVYGYDMDSHSTYQITNTTVPGVYDAYIWANGTKVIMRYLDTDRETIIGLMADIPNVQPGRDPQALENATLLPKGVSSVAVSASSNLLSYLVSTSNGSSVYTVSSKGISRTDSPFATWSLFYGGEQLYATARPSAYVEGMTVALPSFARIIGERTGLSSIGSKSGTLLSSMWSQEGLRSFITRNGETIPLSVNTIASKCGSADAFFICGVPQSIPDEFEGMPDDWYQGRAQFDDTLTLVNTNGNTSVLYSFDQKYAPIDVTSISSTPRGDLISFIKKQDGSLFLLNTNLLNG